MADVVSVRFVIFMVAFAAFVYFQFYLGHREWRRLKGEQAGEIDVNYVRTENYFAQSFRVKATEWLKMPAASDEQGGRFIMKGAEKIRVVQAFEMEPGRTSEDILVVHQDFSCGSNCTLTREVWARGNASIGPETRVQALAAEGDAVLGEKVEVARWLDSTGLLTLGAGCRVGSRITSRKGIRLGLGTEIVSATAPEIGTTGWNGEAKLPTRPERTLFDLDLFEDLSAIENNLVIAGLKKENLLPLSADTWVYRGSIAPSVAIRLKKKLVVQGNCQFAPGSVLEADVKASGSLVLGAGSIAHGNLVADGDIFLAPECSFMGLIHAAASVLLSRGSRGYREGAQVAVYSDEDLNLEADVGVAGKVASGRRVVVLDDSEAADWKKSRGITTDLAKGAAS